MNNHSLISYKEEINNWLGKDAQYCTFKRLKYVAEINPDHLSEKTDPNYEMEYLDISNVTDSGDIISTETMYFEDAPSRARRIPRDNDTIISTVRTYLKAIAYLEKISSNFIVSTGFAVLRSGPSLFPKFLYYLVRSEPFIQKVMAESKGVAYPAINPTELADLEIWYPSKDDQNNILNSIDNEISTINKTVSKYQQFIELLKEKRIALISHVVTKGLDTDVKMKDSGVEWIGEIPEHWFARKLYYCVDEYSDYRGKTPTKSDTGIFLVTAKNIANGRIDYEISQEYIPEEDFEDVMHRGKPKIGDVLFTTEAPLGETAQIDNEDIALAQRVIRLSGKKAFLDNTYLK